MIQIENTRRYNELRRKRIGGQVTSIWKGNNLFLGSRSFPVLDFTYITSDFSDFEKNVFEQKQKMIYHLSGYGITYNEAFASYIGESSERYTFASFYNVLKNFVIKDSYWGMCRKFGADQVCDLRLINSYFGEKDTKNYVTADDVIQWVEMNSLCRIGEKVYLPLQFIVTNNGDIYKNEKPFMTSAVSTGTASQEDVIKSLENAIIEYLQIDSFNLWWYGGVKGKPVELDMVSFLSKYFHGSIQVKEFLDAFHVQFTDISFDKGIDIIVCELFARKDYLPRYTIGVQGGRSKEKVLYRGLMECLAVLEYNMNLPWMDQKQYTAVKPYETRINNLDNNVILYAKYGKPAIVKHDKDIYGACLQPKDYDVISAVKRMSRYAGCLWITLPEFEHMNLEVCRISIPELLPMCLPSFPPYYHKRYELTGGIQNNVPHPLA